MLRAIPTPNKLVQPSDPLVKFIADGIIENESDLSQTKLMKPFEIHYCLETEIYWIKLCSQCLQDDEQGEIRKYFKSIGLDLGDLSHKTHKVTHTYCSCCFDKMLKIADECDTTQKMTNAVLKPK